jgi:hypothetical protein
VSLGVARALAAAMRAEGHELLTERCCRSLETDQETAIPLTKN